MFKAVGTKFIDPNYDEGQDEEAKEIERIRKDTVRISKKDSDKKDDKKGCC